MEIHHKMHKKLALICFAFIMATTIFLPNTLVYGAAANNTSIYDDVAEVTDKKTVLTRGNFLNYGTITLTRIDIMKIRITGDVAAHKVCDKLGLDLFLEKSSDGEYFESYRQWQFTKENDSFFWKGLELIVPGKQWYRLRGSHIAILGNDGESVVTLTKKLYVN